MKFGKLTLFAIVMSMSMNSMACGGADVNRYSVSSSKANFIRSFPTIPQKHKIMDAIVVSVPVDVDLVAVRHIKPDQLVLTVLDSGCNHISSLMRALDKKEIFYDLVLVSVIVNNQSLTERRSEVAFKFHGIQP